MTRNMLNILALIHFGHDPLKSYPARAARRLEAIQKLAAQGFLSVWRGRLFVTGTGYAAMRGAK